MAELVSFGFSTDPAPLQSSGDGEVNVAVAPVGSAPVYCDQVMFQLDCGDADPLALTRDLPGGSATEGWARRHLEPPAMGAQATVTFECSTTPLPALDGKLVLTLSGIVAATLGQAPVKASAHAGTDRGSLSWGDPVAVSLAKVPWTFFARNLVATVDGAPKVPVTEFDANKPINLSWESNGTHYDVYSKATGTPIPGVVGKTLRIPGGIATDTTFVLVAKRVGDQTLTLHESLTLTVRNPEFPDTVTAAGEIRAGTGVPYAALLPTGVVDGENIEASKLVSGESVLATGQVSGASVQATGEVSGASVQATGEVSGQTLQASGAAKLASLLVGSLFAVEQGGIGVAGPVEGFCQPGQFLTSGRYTPTTDGLVIGWIGPAAGNPGAWGDISAGTGGTAVAASGGCMAFGEGRIPTYNSFVLPVMSGVAFVIDSDAAGAPLSYGFYFFPFGRGSAQ